MLTIIGIWIVYKIAAFAAKFKKGDLGQESPTEEPIDFPNYSGETNQVSAETNHLALNPRITKCETDPDIR